MIEDTIMNSGWKGRLGTGAYKRVINELIKDEGNKNFSVNTSMHKRQTWIMKILENQKEGEKISIHDEELKQQNDFGTI